MKEFKELQVEAGYFSKAIKEWEGFSATLRTANDAVDSVGGIPTLWGSAGSLNEVVAQVNEIRSIVANNLMWNGSKETKAMADELRAIAQTYVVHEAQNAEDAAKLNKTIEGIS